jgi:hypothetical protein
MPAVLKPALLLAALFAIVHPARAQEATAPTVSFRVTRFDPADRPPPKFSAGTGEAKVEIEVPLTHIAGPFKAALRDGVHLDLWGDSTEKPAVSLEIKPAEREHLLLVFFPEGNGFRAMKVLASPDRVKGGDRFIINTTPDEIGIKLGNAAPVLIPSAKTGLLAGPPGGKATTLPVIVNRKLDGKWTLASTEDWPCEPRFRKFLIAYLSPRSRQLVFHSVSELAEPPAGDAP